MSRGSLGRGIGSGRRSWGIGSWSVRDFELSGSGKGSLNAALLPWFCELRKREDDEKNATRELLVNETFVRDDVTVRRARASLVVVVDMTCRVEESLCRGYSVGKYFGTERPLLPVSSRPTSSVSLRATSLLLALPFHLRVSEVVVLFVTFLLSRGLEVHHSAASALVHFHLNYPS